MKNLLALAIIILLTKISFAQPKSQDLSAIDPRLTNGFTMTEMKLTGAEFKGKQPQGSAGSSDTKMLIGLRKLQTLQVNGAKSRYFFQVIPYFSFNSWLADTVKKDQALMARILQREQDHYDIHLLMAQELKKELSDTYFDSRDYAHGIIEIRDRLSQMENKIRGLYQMESDNGTNPVQQKKWDDMVAQALQTKNWALLVDHVKEKM